MFNSASTIAAVTSMIFLMIFLYLSVSRPFALVMNTAVGCSLCRASVMPKPPAIWSLLKMLNVVSQ